MSSFPSACRPAWKQSRKRVPEEVFEVNPAACPAASVIGNATVATPVLDTPLRGPAYLVAKAKTSSSAGASAFPDMVLVLQAQGVRIDLTGALYVDEHNITSTTFKTVPDVPIRRLDLVLPEGDQLRWSGRGRECGCARESRPKRGVALLAMSTRGITPRLNDGLCSLAESTCRRTPCGVLLVRNG